MDESELYNVLGMGMDEVVTVRSWDIGRGGWKGDAAGVENFGSCSQILSEEFECNSVLGVKTVDVVAHEGAWDECPNWPFLGARLRLLSCWERLLRESEDYWLDEFDSAEIVDQCSLAMSDFGEYQGSSFCCIFSYETEVNVSRDMSRNPLLSPYGVEACLPVSYSTTSSTPSLI